MTTMVRFVKFLSGLSVAGLVLAVHSAGAFAQGNCDWYASTALRQQQENARLKCGFAGPAWTMDLKGHGAWCAGVSPEASKREAQSREAQLQACSTK